VTLQIQFISLVAAGRTPIEISSADMLAEFFEDIRHTHINLCYYVDKNLFVSSILFWRNTGKTFQQNCLGRKKGSLPEELARKPFADNREISWRK
jgi:hypothetical protein